MRSTQRWGENCTVTFVRMWCFSFSTRYQPFGEVRNATIVVDERSGSSKGFGFVTMAGKEAAAEAVRRLHKTRVPSSFSVRHKIRVKLSNMTGHGKKHQTGSVSGSR